MTQLGMTTSPTLQETASIYSISSILTTVSMTASQPASTITNMSTSADKQADALQTTGECQLLGQFAILVQAALGALALSSLVFKRWRERPQRPWKIWAFDVSKQVLGSVLLHIANVFMSMLSSGELAAATSKLMTSDPSKSDDEYQPNPCSFYLLNLAIDTTLGIPVLIILLRVVTVGVSHTPLANPPESIQSGHYGDPPQVKWWLKQSMIYFVGLLGMKVCVFILFELCPWIIKVGDWALRWTEGNEALQIAFVMFIFPLIMNAAQYYIIDGFIKKKQKPSKEESSAEDLCERNDEEDRLLADEHNDHINPTEVQETKDRVRILDKDISSRDGQGGSGTPSNLEEEVIAK